MSVSDGTFRASVAADDQAFRDPLGGQSSGAKRDELETTSDRLKVTLAPDKSEPGVVVLSLALTIPEGLYTYSMNPEFSGATRIRLSKTDGLEPLEKAFTSDREPHREYLAEFNQEVEKFKDGGVVWFRRFKLADGVDPSEVRIAGKMKFQVCNRQTCTPNEEVFAVGLSSSPADAPSVRTDSPDLTNSDLDSSLPAPRLDLSGIGDNTFALIGDAEPPSKGAESTNEIVSHPFEFEVVPERAKRPDPVKIRFSLSPETAQPGETVSLSVTIKLEPGWHTFALDQNPKNAGLPTLIDLSMLFGLKPIEGTFSPSLMPETHRTDDGKEQRIHHKEITWTVPFQVEEAKFGLSGQVAYQICKEGQCRPLKKVPFELGQVVVTKAAKPIAVPNPVLEPTPIEDDGKVELDGQPFVPRVDDQSGSLGLYLLYAFLGGLILNVMPCVLPVIAIKVLSFVQQAGQSRGRILMLNLTYSGGVIVVFLALASLAVFAKFGWGGLFQKTEFQVAMSCIVFAMGLSLMGVFEIPVPGMIGSAAGQQHQEGPLGAFLTGIFTTLLATPCSGPFLGVALGWSVKQPTLITYLVWLVMGFGMASPYMLLGLFPGWVKYLPKPGNWMVTFKIVCGFVLMGTVLFLMGSLKAQWQMPLLILLLAIAFSLWMIGNLYHINSPSGRRWTIRLLASLVTIGGWLFAVRLADPTPNRHKLPWRHFTGKAVKAELRKGKTVFVDFTASWCAACIVNETFAYNTAETLERIKQHQIEVFRADWTDGSEEVTNWVNAFHSEAIPLAIIFPGNDPHHPIVLRDNVSKRLILEKLDEAVQIKSATKLEPVDAAKVSWRK